MAIELLEELGGPPPKRRSIEFFDEPITFEFEDEPPIPEPEVIIPEIVAPDEVPPARYEFVDEIPETPLPPQPQGLESPPLPVASIRPVPSAPVVPAAPPLDESMPLAAQTANVVRNLANKMIPSLPTTAIGAVETAAVPFSPKSIDTPESRRIAGDVGAGMVDIAAGAGGAMSWLGMPEIGEAISRKAEEISKDMMPADPHFIDSVARGFGSTVPFYVAGLGLGAGAGALANFSVRAAKWFGVTAAAVMEAATEAGGVYNEALTRTGNTKEASIAANKTFWVNTPLLLVTSKLGLFGDSGGAMRQTLVSALMEGSQEASQEMVKNFAMYDPLFRGALEAGAVGALVGAGIKAAGASPVAPETPQPGSNATAVPPTPGAQPAIEPLKPAPTAAPNPILQPAAGWKAIEGDGPPMQVYQDKVAVMATQDDGKPQFEVLDREGVSQGIFEDEEKARTEAVRIAEEQEETVLPLPPSPEPVPETVEPEESATPEPISPRPRRRGTDFEDIVQFHNRMGKVNPNLIESSDIRELGRIDLQNTRSGRSLGDMAMLAVESGFLPSGSNGDDYLQLLNQQIRSGEKVYAQGDAPELEVPIEKMSDQELEQGISDLSNKKNLKKSEKARLSDMMFEQEGRVPTPKNFEYIDEGEDDFPPELRHDFGEKKAEYGAKEPKYFIEKMKQDFDFNVEGVRTTDGTMIGNTFTDKAMGVKVVLDTSERDYKTDKFYTDQDPMTWHIERIESTKKGQGNASKVLDRIAKIADEYGVTLRARPLAYGGGLTTPQLREWYSRHGFEKYEGGYLERKPRRTESMSRGGEQYLMPGTPSAEFPQGPSKPKRPQSDKPLDFTLEQEQPKLFEPHVPYGEPDAVYIGTQKGSNGVEIPLYNVVKKGHPLESSTVSRETLEKEGLRVPETPNRTGEPRARYGGENRPFFSGLQRLLDEKLPNQASVEQVRSIAQNAKKEEIEWSGLEDFLEGKEKVSKAELLDFLRANEVQVQEVMKGGTPTMPGNVETQARGLAERDGHVWGNLPPSMQDEYLRKAENGMVRDDTKFQNYTLPGGENYRELLLTLPSKTGAINFTERDVREWKDLGVNSWNNLTDHQRARIRDAYMKAHPGAVEESSQDFKSSHFDEPNVLAHVRMNDRTDADGKRVLFVEELQSDWHQKGRKEGYQGKLDRAKAEEMGFSVYKAKSNLGSEAYFLDGPYKNVPNFGHDTEEKAWEELLDYLRKQEEGKAVPDAPFKKTWHEMALKRVLRYAAENNYDRIAWTTGEQQAERYDLSKQVRSISWTTSRSAATTKIVTIQPLNANDIEFRVHPDGKVGAIGGGMLGGEFDGKNIADVVGKDVAEKIIADRSGDLSGSGLRVGGEGMKGFYDQIIPSFLNKYAKKWGGKVAETEIVTLPGLKEHNPDAAYSAVHSLDITPSMRSEVMEKGQSLFEKGEEYQLAFEGITPKPTPKAIQGTGIVTRLEQEGYISTPTLEIKKPEDVAGIFHELKNDTREHFYIVMLDAQDKIIGISHQGMGVLDSAHVIPQDAFNVAQQAGAKKVIMVHNHPSGEVDASFDDIALTEKFRRLAKDLDIEVPYHVIIDHGEFGLLMPGDRGQVVKFQAPKERPHSVVSLKTIQEKIKGSTFDGTDVTGPEVLAHIAFKILQEKEDTLFAIVTNTRGHVNGIVPVGDASKIGPATYRAILSAALHHNAKSVMLVSRSAIPDHITTSWAQSLDEMNIKIEDALTIDKNYNHESWADRKAKALQAAYSKVREDGPEYGPKKAPKMRMIAKAQILRSEIGMDEAAWKTFKQETVGKDSLTQMDEQELGKVLTALETRRAPAKERAELLKQIGAMQTEKQLSNNTLSRIKKSLNIQALRTASNEQLNELFTFVQKLEKGDKFLSDKQLVGMKDLLKGVERPDIVPKRILFHDLGEKDNLLTEGILGKIANELIPTVDIKEGHPMVKRTVEKAELALDQAVKNIEERNKDFAELMDKAEASRKKKLSMLDSIKRKIAPQHKEIFQALSGAGDTVLTSEEKAAVDYLRDFFLKARTDLSLEKYRKNYVTHMEQPFLEKIMDKGLIEAIKEELGPGHETDIPVSLMLELDHIIGSKKFFKYALERTGYGKPSTNLRKILNDYSRLFETKKALDSFLPEAQAITKTLLAPETAMWQKRYLQNLKGRGLDSNFRNGKMGWLAKVADGIVDIGYVKLLGLNYMSALKNIVAGEANSFIFQPFEKYVTGKFRLTTSPRKAYDMAVENGIMEGTYVDYAQQGVDFMKKARNITMIGQRLGEMEIRVSLFTGELTAEEWESGKITPARLREMKDVVAMTQGIFSKTETPLFLQTWYGRLLFQMNRWRITNAMMFRRIAIGARDEARKGNYAGPNARRLIKALVLYSMGMYLSFELEKLGLKKVAKIAKSMAEGFNSLIEIVTTPAIMKMLSDNPTYSVLKELFFSAQELSYYIGVPGAQEPKKIEFRRGIEDTHFPFKTYDKKKKSKKKDLMGAGL